MVLDKTSILNLLRKDEEDLERHKGETSIYISSRYNDFNPTNQVGNDSIDLRIDNNGYILSSDYEFINTLSNQSFDKFFIPVDIPTQGRILNPGELLFVATVERIHLQGNIIGRITGRSVFSRMGISVHCTQDKFSSGINSIAGLQIINNGPIPVKIFPFQKLAQIMIEKTEEINHPYISGAFSLEERYTLPKVKSSDRIQYSERDISIILEQVPKLKEEVRIQKEAQVAQEEKSKQEQLAQKKKKTPFFLTIWQTIINAIFTILIGWFCSQQSIVVVVCFGVVYIAILVMFIHLMRIWSGEK